MSRSLARRVTVLTAVGSCLAAASLPAMAAHGPSSPDSHDLTVVATSTGGSRHFHVYDAAVDQAPGSLVFNGNGEQPFRVVVSDVNQGVQVDGFDVSASMTNLHWRNPDTGALDPDVVIPSRNLALGYDSTRPLEATGLSLPVQPSIDLVGDLPTCLDPSVAGPLGITVPTSPLPGLSLIDTLISTLSGATKAICEALEEPALQGQVALQLTEAPVDLALSSASSLLGLADLPVALAGGRESGAFTNPAYKAFRAPTGAPAATTKMVMSGRPQTTSGLLAQLNSALVAAVGTVYGTTSSLVTQAEALTALGGLSPKLVSNIGLLPAEDDVAGLVDALVGTLSGTLQTLDSTALSTLNGTYTARPVLRANTTSARPGTYEGTLTIDFIDGVKSK